jgi:hypothetical protein
MKNVILIILIPSFVNGLFAQNTAKSSNDSDRIAIAAYVPQQIDKMPEAARTTLSNKINQMASLNGLGGIPNKERFILTANVVMLDKEITPTAPPKHLYNLEVTFYIGDGIEGTKFASHSVEIQGIGDNETKAYIAALSQIKTKGPQYQVFLDEGKRKIIEYFNSRCDFILKEAQTLASQQKFDAAIAKLVAVPEVCKSCYDKAMDAVGPIFKQQIERQCKLDMAEANAKWTANQDAYGAEAAAAYLAKIDPNSSCYAEAKVLNDKMAKRVKEIDQREWNFALKQQQDQVDIEKATIKAARDIGVAYGENQPDVIYETAIYGWW